MRTKASQVVNQYLKCMRRVDDARFPACRDEEETAEHFLLRCPEYVHKRWVLGAWCPYIKAQLLAHTLIGVAPPMMIAWPYWRDILARILDCVILNIHGFPSYLRVHITHILKRNMGYMARAGRQFQALLESSLQAYDEKPAGVSLTQHPLAIELENCDSVEAIAGLLQDQAQSIK